MSKYCIYLKLEPYLAQWFVHRHGGSLPVELRRGAPERDLLQLFLAKTPEGQLPELPEPDSVAIALPYFRDKDPRVYNHLPDQARAALAENIRVQFDVELWRDIHTFGNINRQQKTLLYAWMEAHGIECSGSNWDTIAKKYQRKRKCMSRKKQKNLSTSEPSCPDGDFCSD